MSAKNAGKRKPPPKPPPQRHWMFYARLLLAVAALGAGYLAWVSISNGPVAGCGPDSGCNKVLQSRWAYWLGIPVSIPALLVYLGLLAGLFLAEKKPAGPGQERIWPAIIALSVVIAGAAAWFIGLQAFVIRAFCKFCMLAHASGLTAAILCLRHIPLRPRVDKPLWANRAQMSGLSRSLLPRLVVAGLAGLAVLVAGQTLVQKKRNLVKSLALTSATNVPLASLSPPARSNPLTSNLPPPKPTLATSNAPPPPPLVVPPTTQVPAAIARVTAPRLLSLHDDRFQYRLDEVPIWGSPDAPKLVIHLFDYTCPHCRQLHPLLLEAQRRFSNQLAIVMLPTPLATNCNPTITHYLARHSNACDYAQIGLALWRSDRPAFFKWDNWLVSSKVRISPEEARAYATNLIGIRKFDWAFSDDWIARLIHTNSLLYGTNSLKGGNSGLPQLIMGPVVSFGPVDSLKELLDLLQQQLGLKSPLGP